METVRGREARRAGSRASEPGVWMEGRAGKNGRVAHLWMPAPSNYTHATAACGVQAYRGGLEPADRGVHHCISCERLTDAAHESRECEAATLHEGEDLEVEQSRGGR